MFLHNNESEKTRISVELCRQYGIFRVESKTSIDQGNNFARDKSVYLCYNLESSCCINNPSLFDFSRKYVPEVRNLPTDFIFEPWLAPRDLQESCGCVIGQDYPTPLVDHRQQRVVCVQRLRDLAFKLTGN